MSWFGETFGESLTTLKGQITKITKEVLADDDTTVGNSDSNDETSKELKALCESKDLEISSLKEEFKKLQSQFNTELGLIKKENENLKCGVPGTGSNSEYKQLILLQNEISQLQQEKAHLNTCIDELQAEHESNLTEVVAIRDKYKKELEELKAKHNKLDLSLTNSGDSSTLDDTNTSSAQEKDLQIKSLTNQVKNLQHELDVSIREQKECRISLNNEFVNSEKLREELQKLSSEIRIISDEKLKIECDNKCIRSDNENFLKEMESLERENNALKVDLNELLKEKESIKYKTEEPGLVGEKYVKLKLQNLAKMLELNDEQENKELDDLVRLIECKLSLFQKSTVEQVKSEEEFVDLKNFYESQLKNLKEQCCSLENELKRQSHLWVEKEEKYQSDLAILNQKLEESTSLKEKLLEVEMKSQVQSQSQAADVQRLEQEIRKLQESCQEKVEKISDLSKCKQDLEQELINLKTAADSMNKQSFNDEIEKLHIDIETLKREETLMNEEKSVLEEKYSKLTDENISLNALNESLKYDVANLKKNLEHRSSDMKNLQFEYDRTQVAIAELQNSCVDLQKTNSNLNRDFENLKAQVITRENSINELMKSNVSFQEEVVRLQAKINELHQQEEELQKWKNISVDLEIQIQDMRTKIEALEGESLNLKSDLKLVDAKDNELLHLKQANANLTESCNRLYQELEAKIQGEQLFALKELELNGNISQQSQLITEIQEENAELKSRIQKFQEQMRLQIRQVGDQAKNTVQQHRRSKSAADFEFTQLVGGEKNEELHNEVALLKEAVRKEKGKYEELCRQFQGLSDREGNARKEFERLKQHLIEVEDHYTEEAVENEKIINDLKSKLIAAEEQLSNSSTLYTSAKIRDNQHVESLQNQLRLVGAQRDDLQAKLSGAEDEIQRHKASLTSLQIVLEQFQQDKEREIGGVAAKYERQMEVGKYHFKELEIEIEGLQKQLAEAKNGLQAASRLGEQLEKKSQQMAEIESRLIESQTKISEMEEQLKISNQSNSGKVDKSLVKNLVVGYILAPKADRKAQVLRILASVLEFDQEERDKLSVDGGTSGWLANILHPKSGGQPSNESLSEAFIKFLENESRPQPLVNLLPEQYKLGKPRPSTSGVKPQSVLPELILPTFNSPQDNESSIILKNVLRDS